MAVMTAILKIYFSLLLLNPEVSWLETWYNVGSIGVTCLSNHHESCSKCLSWWFLGQVRNWVIWGQKLDHLAKSAENLVNTLVVTFFKQSSWILLNMFVMMISRSDLKLGHLGSKTRSPGLVNTLAVIFLKQSSWILLKMFVLMSSGSSSKLGHLGSKTRSPGQNSRKFC